MRVIFSNGSVIAGMLVKIDMQAQVNQQGLFSVMNDTLSRGALGKYQVDPSSIRLQGTVQFSSVQFISLCCAGVWSGAPLLLVVCFACIVDLRVSKWGILEWSPGFLNPWHLVFVHNNVKNYFRFYRSSSQFSSRFHVAILN